MIYFKDNIKVLRKRARLTQGNIADLLGVKSNTVSNYEQGVSSPDIASLEKLIKILDTDIHSLLFEDLSVNESEKFNTKSAKFLTLSKGKEKGKERKVQNSLPFANSVDDVESFENETTTVDDPEEKFNTKSAKNTYKLNVGKNVGKNVGFRKVQKTPTNNIASDVPVIYDAGVKTLDSLIDAQKVIPLYSMIPVDGLGDLFKQSLTPNNYLYLPHLPKCDGAIYNHCNNMSPDIERGDIIVYKVVKNHLDNIIFGKTCLLSLELGGCEHVTLNEIGESDEEGHISLISRNGQRPQNIPLSAVEDIAIVAVSLRYRSLI